MSFLERSDPTVADIIRREEERQRFGLELIASENYTSAAVLEAMGSVLTNKYAEGFTGTPIEKEDANTRAVFGDYISVYDIERAVQEVATVPIYYESRLAKLELNESELPRIEFAIRGGQRGRGGRAQGETE